MRIGRVLLAAAVAVALGRAGLAQNAGSEATGPLDGERLQAIDAFVASEMVKEHVPGLELGIYNRGQILLAKGYGEANIELGVPVKPETVFQSGSMGKQFVSAAIMMLVEEGRVSLDDSITKYFPDAPAAWKPILIKNLLSHTSGLAEYESDERTGPSGPFYLRLDFTEDELVKKIEAMPIEWAPGTNWAYRNTNYVLLGVVIHKVTGKPYWEFLQERIFRPLGMTSTQLISDRDIVPNRAAGYELENGQLKNQEWVSPTFNSTADGALYFNVRDLAKWDEALYGTRLLKQASIDRMWTVYLLNDGKPNPDNYGFGWVINEQNGHKRIEHSGEWQGFTSHIARYPDDGITVVALMNLAGGNPTLIAHVVAGLADPALKVAKLSAVTDDQPAIEVALTKVLGKIVAGEDIRPECTAELAARITPEASKRAQERLSRLWPGGALTLVKRSPVSDQAGLSTSIFRLSKGTDAALIYFGEDAGGKISTLGIRPDREYE